ncbi:hypothetical protein [Cellulomonas sp. KRMCY2]|uniref:hypothetical protein n=1 Tax=Cellulomonas sp. KRMCY2 TaxID=1304865 RepID=UPI00045E62D3|nr:hypothetical protein [Cellulomonas sp. KRMCY2]
MSNGARLRRHPVPAPLAWLLGALVLAATLLGGAAPSSASTAPSAAGGPPRAVADTTSAADDDADGSASLGATADVVLFWGDGCPRCETEREWLADVVADHPDLTVTQYEVWFDTDNRELFTAAGDELGFTASSVPTTIIGERVWIGWTDPIAEDVAEAIDLVTTGQTVPPGVYGTPGAGTCSQDSAECSAQDDAVTIDVPLVGEVSLGGRSLLLSTVIIGFVDGVNPCSLWVISVLLTIVVRTASRRRVVVIGTTFLVVTAAMYALYMAGIYSALTVVGYIGAIQVIVAVAAGVFGLVSVKDYFAFKKGLSFTIKDSAKPGIYRRVREAAGQRALIPALAATVVLGVAVSLIETPCTAGFPVLWTGLLQANGVGFAEAAGLFVVYMVPFLLDEMIVFGIAVVTMRATKMQEKHGELLKLVAGVTMLALASAMVLDPALMENPLTALALFLGAFVLAGAIHAVTTRVRRDRAADAATTET